MSRIAIINSSTRPGRRSTAVADWVVGAAGRHPAVLDGRAEVEVVDLASQGLPILDEPVPALMGAYQHDHTRRWAGTIASFDGFVFVTPEYNHSMPGALKNAIDFLFAEWGHKAAGFVSYGVHGGTRAVEHLRLVLAELQVATVRSQVALSAFTEFTYADTNDPTSPATVAPGPHQEPTLHELLDEVLAWSGALSPLRAPAAPAVA